MGDVIEGRFITKADISPDSMLEAAIGQLDEVIIVGMAEVRLLEEATR